MREGGVVLSAALVCNVESYVSELKHDLSATYWPRRRRCCKRGLVLNTALGRETIATIEVVVSEVRDVRLVDRWSWLKRGSSR